MQMTHSKKNILSLLFYILICLCISGCNNGSYDELDSDDNGIGKKVRLPVQIDRMDTLLLIDNQGKDDEVIAFKWIDTGLFVNASEIEISTKGSWYPYGKVNDSPSQCEMTTCANVQEDDKCAKLPLNTLITKYGAEQSNGCFFSQGMGIYLLLATKQVNGLYSNPNSSATVALSPGDNEFFTAHLGAFSQNNNNIIKVDRVWQCSEKSTDTGSTVICDPTPISKLSGAKIYLRVQDSYYGDNGADKIDHRGNPYIYVNLKKGVVSYSFISDVISTMSNTIQMVTESLDKAFVNSLRKLINVIIMFYFVSLFLGFLTGMINLTHTEVVVRLLKVAIVFVVLTPDNILASGFKNIYLQIANLSSNIIASSIDGIGVAASSSDDELSQKLNYLKVYDNIFNQILSPQVHIKISALVFTSRIWCIPLMYILIVMIIFIVLRCIALYIAAYVQIAILILILPLLVFTMLFNVTAELFQNWLKYIANSALLIIIATIGIGLTLNIMSNNFTALISYGVFTKYYSESFYWWHPINDMEVVYCMQYSTIAFVLIGNLICAKFIEYAPKFADALTQAQLSPSLQAYRALCGGIADIGTNTINTIKDLNSRYGLGLLQTQSTTNALKAGYMLRNKVAGVHDKAMDMYNKLNREINSPNIFGDGIDKAMNNFRDIGNMKTTYKSYENSIDQTFDTLYDQLNTMTLTDAAGNKKDVSLNSLKNTDTIEFGGENFTKDDIQNNIGNNLRGIGINRTHNEDNVKNAINELDTIKKKLKNLK